VLTSDQGGEIVNKLNDELMKVLDARHYLITAYHPQVWARMPCSHVLNSLQHMHPCLMHLILHLYCNARVIFHCRQMALTRGSTRPCKKCLWCLSQTSRSIGMSSLIRVRTFAYNTSAHEPALFSPFERSALRLVGSLRIASGEVSRSLARYHWRSQNEQAQEKQKEALKSWRRIFAVRNKLMESWTHDTVGHWDHWEVRQGIRCTWTGCWLNSKGQ